ncbi:hypothetical protein F157LOC_01151 [Pectobacterium brasiliense]|nr:hypothetical protein F157LOC_01151 [Pectobacterium brasiliense]
MPFNIVNKKLSMRVAVFLRSTTLINNSPKASEYILSIPKISATQMNIFIFI